MKYEDKVKSITELTVSSQTTNRLFFTARNLAIENMLRRIEAYFREKKFNIIAEWSENYNNSSIVLKISDKDWRHCGIERNIVDLKDNDAFSPCVYSLKYIQSGNYYRNSIPKKIAEMNEILKTIDFFNWLSSEVNKINYPFDYTSLSSC